MSVASAERPGAFTRLLQRIVEVRPEEVKAMFVACAYFFFILTAYYIIRPIRDEMGLAGGVENLPWLFTGTLIAMVAVQPLFGAIVARYPRRQFIPYAYRFFILNLLAFFALLRLQPEMGIWTGRVFFIWAAVFNLFVVSVFWAFMADLFRNEQSKRLFGFIGVGGTLGAVSGAAITAFLAEILGPVNLLLASALCLEIGVQCVKWLGRVAERRSEEPEAEGSSSRGEPDRGPPPEPSAAATAAVPGPRGATSPAAAAAADRTSSDDTAIGGSIISGLTHVFKSPYLLGVCLYMLLYTIGSTFLYFQQAEIIEAHFADRAARTAFFAKIDLAVNALTLFTQAYLTGRMMKWLGVGLTLGLLPIISVVGFAVVGLAPTLWAVIGFQVLRRASNYAVSRPSREVLFTVVPREDKYKAKSFIDTFVYRLGDQVGAWSYALFIGVLGMGIAAISWVGVGLSTVFVAISIWLGRRQNRMAQDREGGPVPVADVAPAGAR